MITNHTNKMLTKSKTNKGKPRQTTLLHTSIVFFFLILIMFTKTGSLIKRKGKRKGGKTELPLFLIALLPLQLSPLNRWDPQFGRKKIYFF